MIMVWEIYENMKGELHSFKFTTSDFLNQYSMLHWIPMYKIELNICYFPTLIF